MQRRLGVVEVELGRRICQPLPQRRFAVGVDRHQVDIAGGAVRRRDRDAGRLAADIADFGKVAVFGLGGAEQRDDRARLVDGLVEFLQLQVVEACARQADGAGERRRVDLDARGLGKGGLARLGRGGGCRAARQRAVRAGRRRRGGRAA